MRKRRACAARMYMPGNMFAQERFLNCGGAFRRSRLRLRLPLHRRRQWRRSLVRCLPRLYFSNRNRAHAIAKARRVSSAHFAGCMRRPSLACPDAISATKRKALPMPIRCRAQMNNTARHHCRSRIAAGYGAKVALVECASGGSKKENGFGGLGGALRGCQRSSV